MENFPRWMKEIMSQWNYCFYSQSCYISRHFVVGTTRFYMFCGYVPLTVSCGFVIVFCVLFVCVFVFWCDTPYAISLWYICNIVQLNSFYIKFESKHFFIYIINCRVLLSKIFHSWPLHCNSFMHCALSWVTVLCWSFVTYFSIIIRLEWSVMAFMPDSTTFLDG